MFATIAGWKNHYKTAHKDITNPPVETQGQPGTGGTGGTYFVAFMSCHVVCIFCIRKKRHNFTVAQGDHI